MARYPLSPETQAAPSPSASKRNIIAQEETWDEWRERVCREGATPEGRAKHKWFRLILKEACRVERCENAAYFRDEVDPYPGAPSRAESKRVAARVHKYEDPFDGGPAPPWFPADLHYLFPKADFLAAEVRRLEAKAASPLPDEAPADDPAPEPRTNLAQRAREDRS